MAATFWADGSDDAFRWNVVYFDDEIVPAWVEPGSFQVKKSRDVDVQKGKSKDAARIKDEGIVPANVEFSLSVADADFYERFLRILAKVDPHRPGATRAPIKIGHPQAEESGVEAITITDIQTASPEPGGKKTWHFSAIQWFPGPKPTKASPKPKAETPPIADTVVEPDTGSLIDAALS